MCTACWLSRDMCVCIDDARVLVHAKCLEITVKRALGEVLKNGSWQPSLSLSSLNPLFPNVTPLPHSFTGLYFTPHPPLPLHPCFTYFE